MRKFFVSLGCLFVPLLAQAVGLGSQSWGENLNDHGGGGKLGLAPLVALLATWAVCWWLGFSRDSPIKGYWWKLFFVIVAPPIFGYIVAVMVAGL